MPALQSQTIQMLCRGINLATDPDNMPEGDYPYLLNVRSLTDGVIEPRLGQINLPYTGSALPANPVHTMFRINNPAPGGVNYLFIGSGNSLYSQPAGGGSYTLSGTGYSGNPLTVVEFRPDQSTVPYAYVADSLKMAKYSGVNGAESPVGIIPPQQPPNAFIYSGYDESISDFTDLNWGAGGVFNNASVAQGYRVNTTISYAFSPITYTPSGVSFWCVVPSSAGEWMQEGVRVVINGTVATIQEAHTAIGNTTISQISYVSNAPGVCDIVLTAPTFGITRNALLLLNPGASNQEYMRVDEVVYNASGNYCVRGTTVNIHGPNEAVSGVNSFDIVLSPSVSVTPGTPIISQFISVNCTGAGVGQLYHSALNLNLSSVFNNALQPDDYIHISVKVDVPSAVVSGAILFDVDNSDFNQNYYQINFQANALQGSISSPGATSPITAAESSITTALVEAALPSLTSGDNYSTSQNLNQLSLQGTSGGWSELFLRVSDLQRVGTDYTKTIKNVVALSIQITTSAACNVYVNSWFAGGTFGPDVAPGTPNGIYYRYRYRDSVTGAKSIQSPGTRYGVFPKRQLVGLNVVNPNVDGTFDYVDYERLDPNLQGSTGTPEWHYVGSVQVSGGTIPTFLDNLTPGGIAANPALETNVIKPFPVLLPSVTFQGEVVGSSVVITSGYQLPAYLLPGTVVIINGLAYQTRGFNTVASSTFQLETQAGAIVSPVSMTIGSPQTFGNPLPVIFGPLGGNTALTTFALGDRNNPGTLYWFNGNDMDSASDVNTLEITDPSEPLIGGCVWNQTVFVATIRKLFIVFPAIQGSGNQFTFTQVPAGSGVISAWCMTAGLDGVYYIGQDGIYQANSYRGASMISKDLWPLFPHEGQTTTEPIALGKMSPWNMQQINYNRLFVCDNDIYVTYIDTPGNYNVLKSSTISKASLWRDATSAGWFPYQYTTPVTYFLLDPQDYQSGSIGGGLFPPSILMGCSDGAVRTAGGYTDNSEAYTCEVITPLLNKGDIRGLKLYDDCSSEFEGPLNITVLADYYTIKAAGLVGMVNANRAISPTAIDLSTAQSLALYTNIAADFTFASASVYGLTKLYSFQYSYYDQPVMRNNLVTQFLDMGLPGWKIAKYIRPEILGTGPVTLTITSDQGYVYTTVIYPGAKLQSLDTYIPSYVKGKLFSFSIAGSNQFVCFGLWIRLKKWGGDRFVEMDVFSGQVPR